MSNKDHTFSKNTFREEAPKETFDGAATKPKPARKPTANKKSKKEKGASVHSFIAGISSDKSKKVIGLFMLLFSVYLLVAFTSYLFTWKADDNIFHNSFWKVLSDNDLFSENIMGKIGAVISYIFIKKWFGLASYTFIVLLFLTGTRLFLSIRYFSLGKVLRYSIFIILWCSVCISFFFHSDNNLILGGVFGYQMNIWLSGIIGKAGTIIMLLFALLAFLIIEFNIHRLKILRRKRAAEAMGDTDEVVSGNTMKENDDNDSADDPFEIFSKPDDGEPLESPLNDTQNTENDLQNDDIPLVIERIDNNEDEPRNTVTEHYGTDTEFDPTLDLPGYKFPGPDLLREYDTGNVAVQNEELEANKNRILKTLNNYGITIDKINATIGPTVTLYEIVPAAGIRVSKIRGLEDDIALSLSAIGIRIIAPMPGKGTIGIEVPNQNPKIVSMKSIIASDAFQNNTFDLPIGLGKTISNKSFVADLTKMPHLLIAGATGQGKSVGLNAIITSLLYKKHPAQLKFVLVDPKKVELPLFSKIERHFLAKLPDSEDAIITDVKKVVRTLNSLCIEMDSRYDLLKFGNVRNIKEYNTKFISRKLNPNDGHHFLPYIVLIVDEFADLIITAGKEVETPITRLAQLARAVGIHLIVATQRPSVNVITGTIKANFPARLAFRVISKIDSRTILDAGGADQLIGRGDMLLSTGSDTLRLQCAFIDTPEVEDITDFIGNQRAYPEAFLLPDSPDEESDAMKNTDPSERDEFFEDAARMVVSHQHGSTSLIQRKLKLGYNRAGRIIDQLEAAGIVGPFEGSKAREVKISNLESLEQFLKSLRDNF